MIRRILAAVVLPLLVTAVTVAGVAWNRSGGRDPIVLSGRELPLRVPSDENTGRSLWIRHEGTWWGGEPWLNPAKLASLGFDTALDPASPDAAAHYGRALRRTVFVALELDGPAWQAWARAFEQNRRRWTPDADTRGTVDYSSRLVPVDAERDPGTLEARYPDPSTHLITRAIVRLVIETPEGGRPRLTGVIEQLAPSALHVPRHLAEGLRSGLYRVRVRYGRRYEPWILGVEP
jgi:hypothetical protein